MKRFFLSLAVLAVSCFAFAEKQLVVELINGSTVEYVLSDAPVVTFQETKVLIRSDKAQADYQRSDVARFYFEDVTNAVDGIRDGKLRIEYVSVDQVVVYGLKDASLVKMFDIAGKQMSAEITASDNSVVIGLESLSQGNYIIALPNHPSIQIKK